MIGVTAFGLFLTPVFYVALRRLAGNRPLRQHGQVPTHADDFVSAEHPVHGEGGGGAGPQLLPAAPRGHHE
ncbi:hypothetical protein, partial [Xenophilus sp.]